MRVVVDADVLARRAVHQLLGTLGTGGAFDIVWGEQLLEELVDALSRPKDAGGRGWPADVSASVADYVRAGFPDSIVASHDVAAAMAEAGGLVQDAGDTHVVALALAGSASQIITANVRDYRVGELGVRHVEVVTADTFLERLLGEVPDDVAAAVVDQVAGRATFPTTTHDILSLLHRSGCSRFASRLCAELGLPPPSA